MDSQDAIQLPNYKQMGDTQQVNERLEREDDQDWKKQAPQEDGRVIKTGHVLRIQEIRVMPIQATLDGNDLLHQKSPGVKRGMTIMSSERIEGKQDRMSILPEDDDHREQNQGDSTTSKKEVTTKAHNKLHDDVGDEEYHGCMSRTRRQSVERLPHSEADQGVDLPYKRIKTSESSEQQEDFHSCLPVSAVFPVTSSRAVTVTHQESRREEQSHSQQVFQTRTETTANNHRNREEEEGLLSDKMSSESPTVIIMSGSVGLPCASSLLSRKYIPEHIPCLRRNGDLSSSQRHSSSAKKMTTTADLMTVEETASQEQETSSSKDSSEDVTVSSSSLLLHSPSYASSSLPSSSSSTKMTGHEETQETVKTIPAGNASKTEIQEQESQEDGKEDPSAATTTVDDNEGPLKLFVGQIPRDWHESDCRQMFESEMGFNVETITVLRDKKTGLSRGECIPFSSCNLSCLVFFDVSPKRFPSSWKILCHVSFLDAL